MCRYTALSVAYASARLTLGSEMPVLEASSVSPLATDSRPWIEVSPTVLSAIECSNADIALSTQQILHSPTGLDRKRGPRARFALSMALPSISHRPVSEWRCINVETCAGLCYLMARCAIDTQTQTTTECDSILGRRRRHCFIGPSGNPNNRAPWEPRLHPLYVSERELSLCK